MKARLIPLYFPKAGRDPDFETQLGHLQRLFSQEAEFLPPMRLGDPLPPAEAVLFPQLLGEAYGQVPALRSLGLPIVIITSEFGTVSMWDWEIIDYLRDQGVPTLSAPDPEESRLILRALRVRRQLQGGRFLVFQDNPGAGFQAEIFKRFYWWEEECTQRIRQKFGLEIERRSYQQLNRRAQEFSPEEARRLLQEGQFNVAGLSERALLSAARLALALREAQQQDPTVLGMGCNCLNESHFSDTTPCLAWNWLFEREGLIWGCEADTLSMLTKLLLYRTLERPVMMTNLYPFRMGQAATKHEHIPGFPETPQPERYILAAHCGYLGVVPQSFASEWTLRPKVLAIVDENAHAIDARLPEGAYSLVKLNAGLDRLSVAEAELERYVQYPDSHCLNGAILRVGAGAALIERLVSHHYILLDGQPRGALRLLAQAFDLELDLI